MQLEALLGYSDTFADVISLSSFSSKAELVVIAEKGREILRDVAHENGPIILKGVAQSVPILGFSPTEKLEESMEVIDRYHISSLEMQLEMNLALMYTILIHGKGHMALIKHRGELVGSATKKIDYEDVFSRMQLAQRFGAIRYFDAAAIKSGSCSETSSDSLTWHLQAGTEAFQQAKNIAHNYNHYNQFLATFNLGRLEFLKGENPGACREYFQDALKLASQLGGRGNMQFQAQTIQYLCAVGNETLFGTVIDDSLAYKITLMKLVTETLKPKAAREPLLYTP